MGKKKNPEIHIVLDFDGEFLRVETDTEIEKGATRAPLFDPPRTKRDKKHMVEFHSIKACAEDGKLCCRWVTVNGVKYCVQNCP